MRQTFELCKEIWTGIRVHVCVFVKENRQTETMTESRRQRQAEGNRDKEKEKKRHTDTRQTGTDRQTMSAVECACLKAKRQVQAVRKT